GAAAVAVRRAWDGRPCRSNVSAFRQEFDRGEGMEPKTALWRFLKVINERISHESLISRRRARGCLYFGPFAGNGRAGQRRRDGAAQRADRPCPVSRGCPARTSRPFQLRGGPAVSFGAPRLASLRPAAGRLAHARLHLGRTDLVLPLI